jgi:hypothetical protein
LYHKNMVFLNAAICDQFACPLKNHSLNCVKLIGEFYFFGLATHLITLPNEAHLK